LSQSGEFEIPEASPWNFDDARVTVTNTEIPSSDLRIYRDRNRIFDCRWRRCGALAESGTSVSVQFARNHRNWKRKHLEQQRVPHQA
jgi:hypothetical protein